jgi:hypothetical protein
MIRASFPSLATLEYRAALAASLQRKQASLVIGRTLEAAVTLAPLAPVRKAGETVRPLGDRKSVEAVGQNPVE